MSHGPSTLGTMITLSCAPISVTSCVRSSSTHGLSRLFTRVHSCVSPNSTSLPTRIRPARAASLRSAGIASSRLPSRMSAWLAMSGTLAAIFSLEASKKWIIRDGGKGISRAGSGAPIASGLRKSRGLLIESAKDILPGPKPIRESIQMAAAPELLDRTDEQKAITEMVRQFVDEQIIPKAEHYDHEDEFPGPIVEQMKELGLFGVTIPEEYGGMGLDLTTYAMIVEELSRGWISISGVVNTHFIGSYLLMKFGTDEQKEYFLPKMATGELRAAFSLSEPEVGSDVQGIKATAKKADDGSWELNGQKMWVTNGLGSGVVFVLMKKYPKAVTPYKVKACLITEKEPWKEKN